MARSLPSWNEGPARDAILAFVESVSSGPDALPESERIAVFDNDGTLWTEKPMPPQLHYVVDQWAVEASSRPELSDRQPYRAATESNWTWLARALDRHYAGDDADVHTMIEALVGLTDGMDIEQHRSSVMTFFRESEHPLLKRPYARAVYEPMLELLRFLEAHAFTVYIVTGGGREFLRPVAQALYGVPPERVIGSTIGLRYDDASNGVRYTSTLEVLDDGPEKPVRIWSHIGRRPVFAFGNSDGDLPMLRFTQGSPRSLALLVHHDDDTGRGDAPYDTGAERALQSAAEAAITIVGVRDDWKQVFPEG